MKPDGVIQPLDTNNTHKEARTTDKGKVKCNG